jgi:anaerobic magnesium-protoporphyrin IX monomethyl ester cyclase
LKVLFIRANRCQHPKEISIGVASLSAVLKNAGHEVDLIDTTFNIRDSEVVARARKFKPDLIGATSLSSDFLETRHLAKLLKEHFRTPIVVGGAHPTVAPEEAISDRNIDAICVGEGEEAILELVESMERNEKNVTIQNFWFKENGRIVRNKPRPLIQDLDSIPHPDYDIFDYPRYLKNRYMMGLFILSRGCPYPCAYCINHHNAKLYKGLGAFVRYRSVHNAIEEIKINVSKYGLHGLEITDDTFTLDKTRVEQFCERYKNEVGLPFYVNARAENITEEMCSTLANAGCRRVSVGLEAGDEKIRKVVLKRNISDEKIIEACRLIKKYGMDLYTYNMLGIPYETMEQIMKTIELNRKVRPDFLAVALFTAFPGTELYELCREKGWLAGEGLYESYYRTSNVKHPNLSLRKLRLIRSVFGFLVFIKYRPKRAIVELIDRNLINFPYYSVVRSVLISKFLRKRNSS